MARFMFGEDFKGFDGGNPAKPWQMIPLGHTREVKLVEGNDALEIRVVSDTVAPDGLKHFHAKRLSASDRLLPLNGSKAGSYEVHAVDPKSGQIQAQLSVDVVKVLTLRIAYYLLPGAPKWNTRELNDAAHKIWFDQAGVELVWLGEWGNEFGEPITLPIKRRNPKDLFGVVDLENEDTRKALIGYGNHSQAGLMVYLLANAVDDANGMTVGSQVIIDATKRKMDTEKPLMVGTLAHEIGHRVSSVKGHDDRQDDLMYKESPHGIRLRKERILKTTRG